jgi:hypothetical protein
MSRGTVAVDEDGGRIGTSDERLFLLAGLKGRVSNGVAGAGSTSDLDRRPENAYAPAHPLSPSKLWPNGVRERR